MSRTLSTRDLERVQKDDVQKGAYGRVGGRVRARRRARPGAYVIHIKTSNGDVLIANSIAIGKSSKNGEWVYPSQILPFLAKFVFPILRSEDED